MTRKLITFLGTGKYETCTYKIDGFIAEPTNYVQEALIDLYLKQKTPVDEIHILLTPEAKNANWSGDHSLYHKLRKFEENGLWIQTHDISSEQSIETIWQLFETIIKIMENQDRVIFDITHSFRYQPMLALLSIHFARITKNIQVDGIYYGVYDPKAEIKEFPIIDLTSLVDMQDWITNVYTFTKTGRVEGLTDWIKEKDIAIRKKERRTTIDLKYVRQLAESWDELISALQTNRIMDLPEKAEYAIESIEQIKEVMLRPAFLPLTELLTKVKKDIQSMVDKDPVLSGLAAIEWCWKHGLYQQSYTMAGELMITATCLKFGFEMSKRDDRLKASKAINSAIKIVQKLKIECEDDDDHHIQKMIDHLLNFPALLKIIHQIGDNRNDINHAGMREHPLSAKDLEKQFKELFERYKEHLLKYYHAPVKESSYL